MLDTTNQSWDTTPTKAFTPQLHHVRLIQRREYILDMLEEYYTRSGANKKAPAHRIISPIKTFVYSLLGFIQKRNKELYAQIYSPKTGFVQINNLDEWVTIFYKVDVLLYTSGLTKFDSFADTTGLSAEEINELDGL